MDVSGSDGKEAAQLLTADDEAKKRNTDCVYFLASPLTCKKGSECEYRHSEGARVNPRDCWYWRNAKCLNPKCAFRHPPQDGFSGPPAAPSGSARQTQSQPSVAIPSQTTTSHVPPYNMTKQSVPCYYFQNGYCMKGDQCPFQHGPPSVGNSQHGQTVGPFPIELPAASRKWVLKEFTQMANAQQSTRLQDSEVPKKLADASVKPVSVTNKPLNMVQRSANTNTETVLYASPQANGFPSRMSYSDKAVVHHDDLEGNGLMENMLPDYQIHSSNPSPQDDKEADELLRESSPGFDVLVDNDEDDSGFLHNEEEYGRTTMHIGGDVCPMDDYEFVRGDYDIVDYHGKEHGEFLDSERPEQPYDGYDQKRRRNSSECHLDRASASERRPLPREGNVRDVNRSDLRYQIEKRRVNGHKRSAVSPVGHRERSNKRQYTDDRHGGHHSSRDQVAPHGSSISNRLRGRLSLPENSSHRVDSYLGARERGRLLSRLSPSKPSDAPLRLKERIKWQPQDSAAGARSEGCNMSERSGMVSLNFAGPKSLAELKSGKESESKTTDRIMRSHTLEKNLKFEAPKSLSHILEAKKTSSKHAGNGEDGTNDYCAVGSHHTLPGSSVIDSHTTTDEGNKLEIGEQNDEFLIPSEVDDGNHGGDRHEAEDVMEMDDHELEQQGDLDDEAINGDEYKFDENAYPDDDQEDDDDDFAKKVGVIFS